MKKVSLSVLICLLMLSSCAEASVSKSESTKAPSPVVKAALQSIDCPKTNSTGSETKKNEIRCFDLPGGSKVRMIWVAPGSFIMGSPEEEVGRTPEREKQKKVKIQTGFWLAETEFTQVQWEREMKSSPSKHNGPALPVDQVSFLDIQAFLKKINSKEGKFRLPSAMEWEYACRAGTSGPYSGNRDEMAWHRGNSGRESHAVATKKPNPWGFFDMHGNILEWTTDIFRDSAGKPSRDPQTGSIRRVQKGGQFTGRLKHTRAADSQRAPEEARDFYVGFRLVRDRD